MPKIRYENINMKPETRAIITQADRLAISYQQKGYDLTLRALYYRFIALDLFPEEWIDEEYNKKNGLDRRTKNTVKNYKRLGEIVQKGRRAGLIDWSVIVDHTRNLERVSAWTSAESALDSIARQFKLDRWLAQNTYVEVWYEKDAVASIMERVAESFRVPSFSCRGYTSDSEIWGAARRLKLVGSGDARLFEDTEIEPRKRDIVILHLGDHDPSGIDMTRDIGERLRLFGAPATLDIRRLALNMDQVEQYNPPPNPAKETDSRYRNYADEHGDESWELDALEPEVLAALIETELGTIIERAEWNEEVGRERVERAKLHAIADHYEDAAEAVREHVDEELVSLEGVEEFEL